MPKYRKGPILVWRFRNGVIFDGAEIFRGSRQNVRSLTRWTRPRLESRHSETCICGNNSLPLAPDLLPIFLAALCIGLFLYFGLSGASYLYFFVWQRKSYFPGEKRANPHSSEKRSGSPCGERSATRCW